MTVRQKQRITGMSRVKKKKRIIKKKKNERKNRKKKKPANAYDNTTHTFSYLLN